MDSPFKQGPIWETPQDEQLHHVETRAESPKSYPDSRRHSSSASTSTRSTGDSADSKDGRGRRTRPSVTSSSSQLSTVQEKNQQRVLASRTSDKPPSFVKLASEETVVSSRKVLTSFSKVASRNIEKEEARRKLVNRYEEENIQQREVYRRLIKWADFSDNPLSWILPEFRRAPLPDPEELKSLARHFYTPRSELKCHICDFGAGRAEHNVVDLGSLEEYWVVKPEWVEVRWIHAPLGLGLTHSSVEDIFLHEGEEGRAFENAGRSGWPYLETEVLNFRHRENFQEMRDVWALLHTRTDLAQDLNESTWKADRNASLHHDIDWRADHLAQEPTFWNLVDSDMPWQLSEGLAMGSQGPKDGLKPVSRHVDKQTLSMYPFYRDAQLVRDPFRAFHRSDGFLLTLSPMNGANYLDKNLSRHLAEPIDAMFSNDDASAIGHAFQAFAENGTNSWHRNTVEWFLVYLLTEVGTTPHNFRQGCNAPSFETAYSSVIQDLKRRRHEPWRPKITVDLVRDYLNCIDEITTIKLITHRKLELFKVMQQDIRKFEAEDLRSGCLPNNPDSESSSARLIWASNLVRSQAEAFDRLYIDLKQSMDALFQLRSIEQNELAIVSDSQNKAIMVFTGVTIVFLPLSFFTSYYGMNLAGIANTNKGEDYFWKVCGTAAFCIVLVVTLGAFRHKLRTLVRAKVGKAQQAVV